MRLIEAAPSEWQAFMVRIPRALHYKLRLHALHKRISASAIVNQAVARYLADEPPPEKEAASD
jgi:hypothetical protein